MATVYMLTTADESISGYSTADFRRLSAAAASDKFRKHDLADSPDTADVILFVGSTYPDHRDVRSHPLLRRYPEKCFLFHSDDYVIPFMRGVYVNVGKRWHSGRTITGPYLQITQWDHLPFVPSLADATYLFSFVGSTQSHRVRRRIMELEHPRAYLEDTSAPVGRDQKNNAFFMVDYQQNSRAHYGEIISRSKFVLCPRGYACSTWRLFEALKAGRVPVVISDQWVPPDGPAWETFSIRVKERDIDRIPRLLEQNESRAETMAANARSAWEDWFSSDTVFHRIIEWCLSLQRQPDSRPINTLAPYVHLLRPFYFRHVVLSGIKHAVFDRVTGLHRLFSTRCF